MVPSNRLQHELARTPLKLIVSQRLSCLLIREPRGIVCRIIAHGRKHSGEAYEYSRTRAKGLQPFEERITRLNNFRVLALRP